MRKNVLKMFLFVLMGITWSLLVLQSFVLAQVPFPKRPVTIWVGFPPGGSVNPVVRGLTEGVEKSLGQKIVIVNKPGGAATVCASLIAKEKPDGYVLGAVTDTVITGAPHYMDLDYDPLRDFSFVILVAGWKTGFMVRADSPFKKWEDLVDWAKKNPGQLILGHSGVATAPHLAMVKLAKKEGFTYKSVTFNGAAPTLTALLGGHVMIIAGSIMNCKPHIEAKTIRPLLAIEKEGFDCAPDTPTFEKMHYNFGIVSSPVLICGPKGISDPVRKLLEEAFIDGMKTETFKRQVKDQELVVYALTEKPLLNYIKNSFDTYRDLVKEAGIRKTEKK